MMVEEGSFKLRYKSRDLVEKGFQELNTDFSVCPIRHSEDRRIETHTIFTVYGYFFVSILRAILKGGGVEYSFRELRDFLIFSG